MSKGGLASVVGPATLLKSDASSQAIWQPLLKPCLTRNWRDKEDHQ